MAESAAETYRRNGFVIFRQVVPREIVEALAKSEAEAVRPYSGPLYRHDLRVATHEYYRSAALSEIERSRSGLLNAHLLKESPIQRFVDALVRLVTSRAVFDCLHRLDSEPHFTLHQTIFFFVSPLTVPHIDRMTLDTAPPGRSFTVWIPIDPIDATNGPILVVPRPLGTYESEADLGIAVLDDLQKTKEAHRNALGRRLQAEGAVAMVPLLNPRDVLVFAPSTPHGSFPPHRADAPRRSIQAIYRPTSVTRWGGYPDHDQVRDPAASEQVVSERFSFLKVALPKL